jgi:hypothetical protein
MGGLRVALLLCAPLVSTTKPIYDDRFMAAIDETPAQMMEAICHFIAHDISHSVGSMIDIGCGTGTFVSACRSMGLAAVGRDGSAAARKHWRTKEVDSFALLDLTQALRSPTFPNNINLDMFPTTSVVTSFEVAEHLPLELAQEFVELLTLRNPTSVLFSAATPGQGGQGHINERPNVYWVHMFGLLQYELDTLATVKLRNSLQRSGNASTIQHWFWYPKNVLVFRAPSFYKDQPRYASTTGSTPIKLADVQVS